MSTNSICQGESVSTMWQFLFGKGIKINFATELFRWDSESIKKAHIHCIIISLADLYDLLLMPKDLSDAHKK